MNSTLWTLAVGATLLCGWAGAHAAQQPGHNPDAVALVKGDNTFAIDLASQLSSGDGNLFYSPYSISSALAMTYAGARGKTADDMAATLKFPFQGNRLHAAFATLIQELDRKGQKRKYQLSVANRLWGAQGYVFLPEFVKMTKDAYQAGLVELDFEGQPDKARQTINSWVEKETQDKIKDLVPAGVITPKTRLVLTNAIYFKAGWQHVFPEKSTTKADFKVAGDKTVKVDMMQQTSFFPYAQTDDLQILEMPYEQNELSMLVLLPKKVDGLAQLEKQLTNETLEKWRGQLKKHQVNTKLPKFKFTSQFELLPVLGKMGMGVAFTEQADFSGMTTREKLFISAVLHKAFVAVDEKGTEAAAATAVVMMPTAIIDAPMATFAADHPFVFLIRDNRTGSILFMGRVAQP
jgi:serine protease inhibitor